MVKIGRNAPCPCGRNIKYKKCCGIDRKSPFVLSAIKQPSLFKEMIEKQEAQETIRKQQQGLGKAIISADFNGQKVIAVKNRVFFSSKWKTFPDFLPAYLKSKMGEDWINKELTKNLKDRHPIIQWYDKVCSFQQKNIKSPGNVSSMNCNGAINCFFGLAYSLYLLEHNIELQEIYISRLKDINNFQGAYYELIVANCLIRAGFKLELEDETDKNSKHCEFSATSIKTNKKYWVEAKMRSVIDVLGKTASNGTSSKDPTKQITDHINNALKKPANGERLIFVDLNSPEAPNGNYNWGERAGKKLDMKERDLKVGDEAYIFVTNMNFHWHLEEEKDQRAILAHGLGIPDFAKPGTYTLSEVYKRKQKHMDAYCIVDSFRNYPQLPSTFDGSLPSETLNKNSQPIKIGEIYNFEDIGEFGLNAKVTAATVNELEKLMYIITDTGHLLTRPMSEDELADYKIHKDVYFGKMVPQGKRLENPIEFFEHMVEIHLNFSQENMISRVKDFPDFEKLKKLSHEELVLEYCERIVLK